VNVVFHVLLVEKQVVWFKEKLNESFCLVFDHLVGGKYAIK
jgi:hypothetical protein